MIRTAICIMLSGAMTQVSAAEDSAAFQALHEKDWAFRLAEFPELASAVGDESQAHRLGRVAPEDQQRRYQFRQQVMAELQDISCERLSHAECINYRIFFRQIRQAIEDHENQAQLIPFNSDWGFYMSLARLPK